MDDISRRAAMAASKTRATSGRRPDAEFRRTEGAGMRWGARTLIVFTLTQGHMLPWVSLSTRHGAAKASDGLCAAVSRTMYVQAVLVARRIPGEPRKFRTLAQVIRAFFRDDCKLLACWRRLRIMRCSEHRDLRVPIHE